MENINNNTNCFDKILNSLMIIEENLAKYLFLSIIFFYSYEIFFRLVVRKSVIWILNLGLLLWVWVVFLVIPPLYFQSEFITVSFFLDKRSSSFKFYCNILGSLLIIGFSIVCLTQMPKLISLQLQRDFILPFPRYVFSVPIIISSISMILVYINKLSKLINKIEKNKTGD